MNQPHLQCSLYSDTTKVTYTKQAKSIPFIKRYNLYSALSKSKGSNKKRPTGLGVFLELKHSLVHYFFLRSLTLISSTFSAASRKRSGISINEDKPPPNFFLISSTRSSKLSRPLLTFDSKSSCIT